MVPNLLGARRKESKPKCTITNYYMFLATSVASHVPSLLFGTRTMLAAYHLLCNLYCK